MKVLLKWVKINSLKANPEKFQFMIVRKRDSSGNTLKINKISIKETGVVTLLGV